MRIISVVVLLFCCLTGFSQDDSCILIRYKNYKAVIYQSNFMFTFAGNDTFYLLSYQVPFGINAGSEPWTPTVGQIKDIEKKMKSLLVTYISKTTSEYPPKSYFDYILKNINNYNRQYFSCMANDGAKIIHIDFNIRKKGDNLDVAEKYFYCIAGGGPMHFSVTYNFDLEKISDIRVNAAW